jgi:hypothetical protein
LRYHEVNRAESGSGGGSGSCVSPGPTLLKSMKTWDRTNDLEKLVETVEIRGRNEFDFYRKCKKTHTFLKKVCRNDENQGISPSSLLQFRTSDY